MVVSEPKSIRVLSVTAGAELISLADFWENGSSPEKGEGLGAEELRRGNSEFPKKGEGSGAEEPRLGNSELRRELCVENVRKGAGWGSELNELNEGNLAELLEEKLGNGAGLGRGGNSTEE